MEIEEMKDRIAHIIRAKNLTAAEFAIQLGIQPSNVSHLLSGRNNPSLDFVKKLKETFPEYNLDWIVFGRGPMTVSEPLVASCPSIEQPVQVTPEVEEQQSVFGVGTLFSSTENEVEMPLPPSSKSDLKRIVLVYADNTFEVLSPR